MGDLDAPPQMGTPWTWKWPQSYDRAEQTSTSLLSVCWNRRCVQIPILTKKAFTSQMPPGTLVRYRGMVQYAFPVMYHEPAIAEAKPGGAIAWHMARYGPVPAFAEATTVPPKRASLMQFYCVPTPAQAVWSRSASMANADELAAGVSRAHRAALAAASSATGRTKRRADEDAATSDVDADADDDDEAAAAAAVGAASPARTSSSAAAAPGTPSSPATVIASSSPQPRRARVAMSPAASSSSSSSASGAPAGGEDWSADDLAPLDAYNPFPGEEDECPCLATLFSVGEHTPMRPGQAVEVIGVLQGDVVAAPPGGPGAPISPEEAAALGLTAMQAHLLSRAEHWALNPSAAQVPRMHAVVWRTLGPAFPLLQPPPLAVGPFALQDVATFVPRTVTAPSALVPAQSSAGAAAAATASTPGAGGSSDPFAAAEAAVAATKVPVDPAAAFARELQMRADALDAVGTSAIASLPATAGVSVQTVRTATLAYLTALCGGDALAGEFLLLALLSRVVARPDDRTIGKMSLNLSGLPAAPAASPAAPGPAPALARGTADDEARIARMRGAGVSVPLREGASHWARMVHAGIRHVAPRAALLPMTAAVLQHAEVVPRKDNTLDRLRSGALQVPDGTAMVVDETQLAAGEYAGRAAKALQALKTLATDAKVLYDFSVSETAATAQFVPMPADLPTIVLSGGRSLLDCDAHVPLSAAARAALAQAAATGAAPPAPSDAFSSQCRLYLAAARCVPFAFPDALREAVQRDLAAYKRAHTASSPVTDRDLYRLMDMARLVTASLGLSELTEAAWAHVKQMETERRARAMAAKPVEPAPASRAGSASALARAAATPPRSAGATPPGLMMPTPPPS